MDLEREAEVGRADAVGEAVGPEKRGALVRHHRDLWRSEAWGERGRPRHMDMVQEVMVEEEMGEEVGW